MACWISYFNCCCNKTENYFQTKKALENLYSKILNFLNKNLLTKLNIYNWNHAKKITTVNTINSVITIHKEYFSLYFWNILHFSSDIYFTWECSFRNNKRVLATLRVPHFIPLLVVHEKTFETWKSLVLIPSKYLMKYI